MDKNLNVYKITIDPEFGDGLGVDMVSFVSNPAVLTKGMAFNEDKKKNLFFSDNIKMRLAAPALIPMDIYRDFEDEECYVQFSEDVIEQIHLKFMQNLTNKNKFDKNHNGEIAPAFILECWLVGKDPKADRSYSEFGIEVPKGSLFLVAQITDREYFNKLVTEECTGFSVEGIMGMKLSEIVKKDKQKMSKIEFKFSGTTIVDGKELTFVNGELTDVKLAEVVEKKEEEEVVEEKLAEAPTEEAPVEETPVEVSPEVKELNDKFDELLAKYNELVKIISDMKSADESKDKKEDVVETPTELTRHERFTMAREFYQN